MMDYNFAAKKESVKREISPLAYLITNSYHKKKHFIQSGMSLFCSADDKSFKEIHLNKFKASVANKN